MISFNNDRYCFSSIVEHSVLINILCILDLLLIIIIIWLFAQSLFTDDRAVFLQTFQYFFVGHGVRYARQRQDYGARSRVHQQQWHVTDPERRVQRPF